MTAHSERGVWEERKNSCQMSRRIVIQVRSPPLRDNILWYSATKGKLPNLEELTLADS